MAGSFDEAAYRFDLWSHRAGGKRTFAESTRKHGLYHEALQRRGVHVVEVSESDHATIDKVVDLVIGFSLDEAGVMLSTFLTSHARRHRFTGLVAGCTELPLALDNAPSLPGSVVVESNRALANALVDVCLQERFQLAGRSSCSSDRYDVA